MVQLRAPRASEFVEMTELCVRAKLYWGYDPLFVDDCRRDLRLLESELTTTGIQVATEANWIVGVVQYSVDRAGIAYLEKLCVEPKHVGKSIGSTLFQWAILDARSSGASRLVIQSDEAAAGFFQKMGALVLGQSPPDSPLGRPSLSLDLAL